MTSGGRPAFQTRIGDIDDLIGDLNAECVFIFAVVMVVAAIRAMDMAVMVVVVGMIGHGRAPLVLSRRTALWRVL